MSELVTTKDDASKVALPAIKPLSSDLLTALTQALHVDRGVLAQDDQIEHAWINLPRLLSRIPPQHRTETLVRMCVAVATGLFDSAINYAWNAVVVELRNKVRRFGLSVVPQVIAAPFDEEALVKLRDSELLDLCLKLNLISEEGYFLLSQNREVRNNFSVAHPSVAMLDEDEFLNFLNRCGRHALSDEHNPKGVDLQALLTAIKASRFTTQQLDQWAERVTETFEAQRELLIGTLHGIYCDPASNEQTRLNALDLCAKVSSLFTPRINSNLVDRHQDYAAKGDADRHKASRQFFERMHLVALLGDAEVHHIVSSACDSLLTTHQSWDNFYNEPPFAQRLLEITSQGRVPDTVRDKFVETVITCGVGTQYGVSNAALPAYEKMVQSFSPAEVGVMLNLPAGNGTVAFRIRSCNRCARQFQALVKLLNPASVPTVAQPRYKEILATQL